LPVVLAGVLGPVEVSLAELSLAIESSATGQPAGILLAAA